MCSNVDVFERLCNGERFFFQIKVGVKSVLCKNVLLADLLGSKHLLEILQTLLTYKNSENVVKSGCFEKLLK